VLFSDEAVQLQNLRALAGWFDQAVQPFVSEWEHPMPNLLFLLTYAPLQLLHTWDLIRPATVVLNCLMIEAAAHLLLQVLRQCEPNTKTPKASASLLYLAVYASPFVNYSGMIMTESATLAASAAIVALLLRATSLERDAGSLRALCIGGALSMLVYVKVQLALVVACGLAFIALQAARDSSAWRVKMSLMAGTLFALVLGQILSPVAGLGGYAKDIAPYTLKNFPHIASTAALGIVSLGIYSLLLFPATLALRLAWAVVQ
jgi:hypothetical protein